MFTLPNSVISLVLRTKLATGTFFHQVLCCFFSLFFFIFIQSSFWANGDFASPGLKDVAESGSTRQLESELKSKVSIFTSYNTYYL